MKKILLSSLVLFAFGSNCYGEDFSDELDSAKGAIANVGDALNGYQSRATVKVQNSTMDVRADNANTLNINSNNGLKFNGANAELTDSDIYVDAKNRETVNIGTNNGIEF
jgi:hypothetical protein